MRTRHSEAGFSLVELLAATTISLVVLATAMGTFKDAVSMNDVATNLADASQNLRGGTNFLVRDLMSAGRQIPTGGIPIPSGVGALPIARPGPAGTPELRQHDTDDPHGHHDGGWPRADGGQPGDRHGHDPDDRSDSRRLPERRAVRGPGRHDRQRPRDCAADGSSFSVGTNVPCLGTGATGTWIVGDATQGQSPIKKGDLILFTDPNGKNAIQTVTRT